MRAYVVLLRALVAGATVDLAVNTGGFWVLFTPGPTVHFAGAAFAAGFAVAIILDFGGALFAVLNLAGPDLTAMDFAAIGLEKAALLVGLLKAAWVADLAGCLVVSAPAGAVKAAESKSGISRHAVWLVVFTTGRSLWQIFAGWRFSSRPLRPVSISLFSKTGSLQSRQDITFGGLFANE